MATFTRNSIAYTQHGELVNTNLPRYEFSRFPQHRWQDLFNTDLLATEYVSGGDAPATWAVSGGVLSGTGGNQSILLKTGLILADCEISINTDQASDSGIIARHVDNNNHYLLMISDDSGIAPTENLRLFRRVAGALTQLATANVTWARGTAQNIRFTLHGSRFEVFFNHVRAISVVDTSHTSGSVGLRNNHATAFRVLDFTVHQAQRGIMVEEGTTNLLNANQSSIETNLAEFDAWSNNGQQTFVRDTTVSWHGAASLRLTSTFAGTQDVWVNNIALISHAIVVTVGLVYTFSVWLRLQALPDRQWQIRLFFITEAGAQTGVFTAISAGTSAWTRVSVSGIAPANTTRAYGQIAIQSAAQNEIIWLDGLQLEQKPYATSWQIGGTPRAAESLRVPVSVFNRGNWTVEGNYTPQIPMNVGGVGKHLFAFYPLPAEVYALLVDSNAAWHFLIVGGGVSWSVLSAANAVVQGISYHWQISGNSSVMRLCINGVQIGTDVPYTEPSVGSHDGILLGVMFGALGQANGILHNVRFSNHARTLAEHQATFNTGQPFVADSVTNYLLVLNNNLNSFLQIRKTPYFRVTQDSRLEPLGVLILRGSSQDLIPTTREATVSVPGRQGLYDFGSEFAQRTFEFKVAIEEKQGQQTKQLLAQHLNPLVGKQSLIFENDINKMYMVKCAGQVVLDKFLNWLDFTIPFTADPIIIGSLEKHQTGSGILKNDGTFEAPLRVRITGAVTNPSVTVGGSILRWTGVLTAIDVLEIDTEFMTVRLNGVNALFNYIGGFPKLLPGGTSVSATVTGTTTWMWRDRWI